MQSEFADSALSLSSGLVAVISIDRCETVNATRMSPDQLRESVIHGHGGFVRYAAFCFGDQLDQKTDDTRTQCAVADIF